MTRTTDDLQDRDPWKPFGEKVQKQDKPAQPEWTQVPGAAKGVEQNRAGQMRTNIPENGGAKWISIHIHATDMKITGEQIRKVLRGLNRGARP